MFIKVIICFLVVFYISKILNYAIKMWQALPIKEVYESPFYITKELFKNDKMS